MVPYRRLRSLSVTSALSLSHDQEPTSATAPGRGQSWPFSRLSRPAAAAPQLLCPGASVRSANGLCERSPERPRAGRRRPSPGTLQRAQGTKVALSLAHAHWSNLRIYYEAQKQIVPNSKPVVFTFGEWGSISFSHCC